MKAYCLLLVLVAAALAPAQGQTNAATSRSPLLTNNVRKLPADTTASQMLSNRLDRARLTGPRGAAVSNAFQAPLTGPTGTVTTLVPVNPTVTTAATNTADVPTRESRPMPAFPVPNLNDDVPAGPPPGPGQAARPASGFTPSGASLDENAGTISLKGASLEDVFDLYSRFSERTVLRPYQLPISGITLFSATDLSRREAIEALDSVLALNGVVMINMGDKFVKAVPAAQADKEGANINAQKTSELPDAEVFVTKIVTLKVAKPSEIAPTLLTFAKNGANAVTPIDSNNTVILRDYASSVKRMMELIEKIDVEPEQDYTLAVIPIRYGKVTDIYATMSALISGGGGGGAGSGFTQSGVGGRGGMMQGGGMYGGSGMYGGMGGGRGSYGNMNRGGMSRGGSYGGNYGGYNTGGYGNTYYPQSTQPNDFGLMTPQQVAQPSAAGANANFQSRLNQLVSKAAGDVEKILGEGANIVPDERSNKLLIYANKRDMAMITNIVEKVDVLLAQVLIEAIILEVVLGDDLSYGVSATQRPKQFGNDFRGGGAMNNGQAFLNQFTNVPPVSGTDGFSYAGTIGQTFDVAINAIASDRKANLVSKPRIQTSHAIPGFIFVGETRPYVMGYTGYGGIGAGLTTQSQVQERTIGLTLQVTPFITPEGLVVMEMQQDYETFTSEVEIDDNPYPLVDSRSASSMLTVRDGDIIMLGGLIREANNKSKSGVPILKDIPGLGALFRNTSQSSTRTELIILLKATVLQSPEQASFMANTERMTLPGVRQAEMEFEKSEADRNKKANKDARRRR